MRRANCRDPLEPGLWQAPGRFMGFNAEMKGAQGCRFFFKEACDCGRERMTDTMDVHKQALETFYDGIYFMDLHGKITYWMRALRR